MPAEYVRGVEDDAIDYEVWILDDGEKTVDSLTIYASDSRETFWLVGEAIEDPQGPGDLEVLGSFSTYEEAKEALETAKEERA